MKFTFTCKKIALNDSIKEYAEKKISQAGPLLPGGGRCICDLLR